MNQQQSKAFAVTLPDEHALLALGEVVTALAGGDAAASVIWLQRVREAAASGALTPRFADGIRMAGTIGEVSGTKSFFLARDVGEWLRGEGAAVTHGAAQPATPTIPVDCINLSMIATQLAFYQAREYPADDAVRALLGPWDDDEIYFTQGYAERVLVEIALSHRIQHLVDSETIHLYDAAARGPMASRYDALVSVREVREKLAAQGTLPPALAEAIQKERESKVWLWKTMTDFEKRNLAHREDGETQPRHLREWLKHDTWDVDTAMTLLVGIDPGPDRLVTTGQGDSEKLLCGWYLDGSIIDLEGWVAANILRDAGSKQIELPADEFDPLISLERMQLWGARRRLQTIWNSGEHKPRNPPLYYIEWAQAKQHHIPWLDWARSEYSIDVEPASDAAEPSPDAAAASSTATVDDWREAARQIADECFDRDTANNCRDSLAGYAARVMDEMQKRGISGPRGRIDNSSTIQREALQGARWWTNKRK